jgi:Fe-S cluster biosynthesis and repair protein YggX
MELDRRIQQFKQMAEADPDNELGHFSLGKAYFDAGRFEDAVASLTRTLHLNPMMSKGYQLLGDAYDRAGKRAKAIEVMTKGVTVADEQGDRMPRDAMARILQGWDVPVPAYKTTERVGLDSGGGGASALGFQCSRCGRPDGQLAKRPFKGPLGEKILANVCTGCWKEWIGMGTKVINELGLALSSPAGQQAYDQYLVEFLQLEDR